MGTTQIAEAVNLRLQVYSKAGAAACGVGLNTFLGTTSALSDPHIIYDNLRNRYSMVVTVVPAPGATRPSTSRPARVAAPAGHGGCTA